MPLDSARRFGPLAAAYAESRSHAQGRTLAMLVEAARPAATDRVLDVATGAGHAALALAAHTRTVVALDPAAEMVARALALGRERGLRNVHGIVARAERLPFGEQRFDVVTCRTAAHHFEEVGVALGEMCRVLVAGGRLALSDLVSAEEPALRAFQHQVELLHDPTHRRALTRTEWHTALAAAGFRDIALAGGVAEGLTELPQGTNVATWCARSRTEPAAEAEIRRLLTQAPDRLRRALRVTGQGDELSFAIYKLVASAQR